MQITHSNIVTSLVSASLQMKVTPKDRYLAFLPLAHVMELAAELSLLVHGSTIFYSSPHTITGASPKVKEGVEGDARVAKPTIMSAVPLVLELILKAVLQKVQEQGWLTSFVFSTAIKLWPWTEKSVGSYFTNKVIFGPVREEMGG